eukprot:TRINITY_DN66881_c1_g1_i1.p1 TRINITY_DN66881_c1_g1~~TRINITY_DN66881_c1_g1_i1.p1  ORF type:complete len:104 (+),score=1.61 TRINITY_DN66881_c1_g1_i1:385-696(+)
MTFNIYWRVYVQVAVATVFEPHYSTTVLYPISMRRSVTQTHQFHSGYHEVLEHSNCSMCFVECNTVNPAILSSFAAVSSGLFVFDTVFYRSHFRHFIVASPLV